MTTVCLKFQNKSYIHITQAMHAVVFDYEGIKWNRKNNFCIKKTAQLANEDTEEEYYLIHIYNRLCNIFNTPDFNPNLHLDFLRPNPKSLSGW